MWWKNFKMQIIIALIVVTILTVIVSFFRLSNNFIY
jgi:hypothetical protein